MPTLAIIGPGKVGTSIGFFAARAGYNVVAVGGRNKTKVAVAAQRIGMYVRICNISEAVRISFPNPKFKSELERD